MRTPQLTSSDIDNAIIWRAAGWSWREIGIQLANTKGRRMPFQAKSIYRAVRPFTETDQCPKSSST